MFNTFAKCISAQCDKYLTCQRAISESNAEVDYIKVDEGECKWYNEIVGEISDINVERGDEEGNDE